MTIGDSLDRRFDDLLADEHPEIGVRGPKAFGGTPVTVNVYVEDVNDVFGRAVKAGAEATGG